MEPSPEYRFDAWLLRGQPPVLYANGVRVRLQEQPLKLLDELLAHAGDLVTRDQLIARLWPQRVVDYDTALNAAVRRLRKALQDEADTPRYIETVPRHGYRFIGTLRPAAAPERPAPASQPASSPSPVCPHVLQPVPSRGQAVRLGLAAGLGLLLGAALLAGRSDAPVQILRSSDPVALDLYERANYLLQRRADQDLSLAQHYYQQAVDRDPGFAAAWAGLSEVHWLQWAMGGNRDADRLLQVRSAAQQALALDPAQGRAHLRLANYANAAHDRNLAAEQLRLAHRYAPDDPVVLSFAASDAAESGDLTQAIELQQRAVSQDPLLTVARYNLAVFLAADRRYDAAETEFRKLMALHPDQNLLGLAELLIAQRRFDEARALVDSWNLPQAARQRCLALIHIGAGRTAEADAALDTLVRLSGSTDAFAVAEVYAFRGDVQTAFQWLQRTGSGDGASRRPGARPDWEMTHSAFVDGLRNDPRWQRWQATLRKPVQASAPTRDTQAVIWRIDRTIGV